MQSAPGRTILSLDAVVLDGLHLHRSQQKIIHPVQFVAATACSGCRGMVIITVTDNSRDGS